MGNEGDGVLLEELLPEYMHAGGGYGDAHIERPDIQEAFHVHFELQAGAHQDHHIRPAVFLELLVQVEFLAPLSGVPGVELLPLGDLHVPGVVEPRIRDSPHVSRIF